MISSAKYSCHTLFSLLKEHGVKDVVISPGSRNTPLILAAHAETELRKHVVVDERCAGFIGLGLARTSGRPVALVCTSGTALLNYSPSVAEAMYQGVPLVVVSADRPMQWIDQDDSQTLKQFEVMSNFIKKSYDIPDFEDSDKELCWYANRIINDALIECRKGCPGPVHINIQLNNPLSGRKEYDNQDVRAIRLVESSRTLDASTLKMLADSAVDKKILVICGFDAPNNKMNRAIAAISSLPNVAVFTETIANIHCDNAISNIDRVLCTMSESELCEMRPDIVISVGGAVVSRYIKQYLRQFKPEEHWYVGNSTTTVDCFQSLTMRIESEPSTFLSRIAGILQRKNIESSYAKGWNKYAHCAKMSHDKFVSGIGWSDLKFFSMTIPQIPSNFNLHLSNGTSIRYAQLFDCNHIHASYCNRGVSGIDGCTSTAIGSAMAYSGPTLLITGDMSFSYDIGALGCKTIPRNFKIIVVNNSGGGIFRFISTTRELDELEQYFAADPELPIQKLAEAFGFNALRAESETELMDILPAFFADEARPALLEIRTPADASAKILIDYMKRNK